MIKNNSIVIFDVGAVLLELTYGRFIKAVSSYNSSTEAIKECASLEMCDITGQISKGDYITSVKKILDLSNKMTDEDVVDTIALCWGNQVDEMVSLKERIVKNGYTVGILSNIGRYSHKVLQEMHPDIFKTFGGPEIYSYKLGVVKPAIQIYEQLPKTYSQVFFIDDKEAYLVAAEKLGWIGIHFTPYIDHAEMMRSIKGHTGQNSSTIKVANSVDDVVDILVKFGLNIK